MPVKIEMSKRGKNDVAKATILVLLILTILLSVISTWYILDTINSVKQQYSSISTVTHGRVSVEILPEPEAEHEEGITTQESIATGNVVLTILPRV